MQIKITVRYDYTPSRMAKIKMYVDQLKFIRPLGIYFGEMKMYVPERLIHECLKQLY